MTEAGKVAARDWLLELGTVDNEDEFKDVADVALRANSELQHEILILARRHNGDLEQWVIDTVHDIQRERAEARKEELAKAKALAPKLQPEDDTATALDRAIPPSQALVPTNYGGPFRVGREVTKIFSPAVGATEVAW